MTTTPVQVIATDEEATTESLTRLKQASREELLATPGVPDAVAEQVYRYFAARS